MRKTTIYILLIATLCIFGSYKIEEQLSAVQIIEKANELRYGETSVGSLKMSVVRPKYTRTIQMKMWTKGKKYSMVLITAPAAEKGQIFMKRQKEMWNYIPKISRMVKMPPSMMAQGWMGSDYSNDDLMNEGALVNSYNHKILGTEVLDGLECYKIESKPKADSDEVWGKKLIWISKKGFYTMKTMSYDEDNFLVKTETATQVKTLHNRRMPTVFTITPEEDPGHQTVIELIDVKYNEKIDDAFFSQQNMKRIR